LAGKRVSLRPPRTPTLYLDECLPPAVGEALALVGHAIIVPEDAGKRGAKDPDLIPSMAQEALVWVTKGDDAKRSHHRQIRQHQLSVVWVRGLDRSKSFISVRQLHLMLTVKLPEIVAQVAAANGARYFELGLKSGQYEGHPVLNRVDQERMQPGARLREIGI